MRAVMGAKWHTFLGHKKFFLVIMFTVPNQKMTCRMVIKIGKHHNGMDGTVFIWK